MRFKPGNTVVVYESFSESCNNEGSMGTVLEETEEYVRVLFHSGRCAGSCQSPTYGCCVTKPSHSQYLRLVSKMNRNGANS